MDTNSEHTNRSDHTPEQLQTGVPIFDAHSDLPLAVASERRAGRDHVLETDWAPGMTENWISTRVSAIFVESEFVPEMALHRALTTLMELKRDLSESDGVTIATSSDDIMSSLDIERATLILALEGAEPLMGAPELLDVFHELGVRVLTLTHSRRNAVASGVGSDGPRPGGLSEVGGRVVDRAMEHGIAIDVSHLNPAGFWDVIERSSVPVIASHSNCRALTDTPRNLTDPQIEAIAETGGVVCITAVGPFVDDTDPTLERVLDHVEHAVDIAGVNHVGLGFDFFKYLTDVMRPSHASELEAMPAVSNLRTDADVSGIQPRLQSRGYTNSEIAAIAGENLHKFFCQILP